MYISREPLLKGKAQYRWPPCTNYFGKYAGKVKLLYNSHDLGFECFSRDEHYSLRLIYTSNSIVRFHRPDQFGEGKGVLLFLSLTTDGKIRF